jgi:hypothetical protein
MSVREELRVEAGKLKARILEILKMYWQKGAEDCVHEWDHGDRFFTLKCHSPDRPLRQQIEIVQLTVKANNHELVIQFGEGNRVLVTLNGDVHLHDKDGEPLDDVKAKALRKKMEDFRFNLEQHTIVPLPPDTPDETFIRALDEI